VTFHPPLSTSLYLLIAVCGVALSSALILRSKRIPNPGLKVFILVLRLATLAILLLILANPVYLEQQKTLKARDRNLFLVDTSESMGLEAPRTRLSQACDLLTPILTDPRFRPRTQAFSFDTDLVVPRGVQAPPLPPQNLGKETRLGQALVRLAQTTADEGVANIVVLSDGRIHDRERLGEAARLALRQGIPISTFAMGKNSGVFNLAIQSCQVERYAPAHGRVPVRVVVDAKGTSGQIAKLGIKTRDGRLRVEKQIELSDGRKEITLPLQIGAQTENYVLQLTPLPGEITHADNVFEFRVGVTNPMIRILYMEGSTSFHEAWGIQQYDFLPRAFRETGHMEVDVLIVDVQKTVGGRLFFVNDPRRGYPRTREELFSYDVIICSDINRFIFTPEQLEWTVELVAKRGGGFCMVGGVTSFGAGGWDKTVWEKMIPVDMTTMGEGYVWETIPPVFPASARNHPILQLDPDPARCAEIIAAHPPFEGTNFVNRAKPGATVLAVDPVHGNMPLITVQSYEKGRSMAFTSDVTCAWGSRYQVEWGEGPRNNCHYNKFWANAMDWLAENSVRRKGPKLAGETEEINYKPGDSVKVSARLLAGIEGADAAPVRVTAQLNVANAQPVPLRYDAERQEFLGEVRLPEDLDRTEAEVVFRATGLADQPEGEDRLPIRILHVDKELADPSPDPALLGELAQLTGGRALRDAADLRDLLDRSMRTEEQNSRFFQIPLWDNFPLWALAIFLLSIEWIVRKVAGAS
jgi:uncharacterized membrane protein